MVFGGVRVNAFGTTTRKPPGYRLVYKLGEKKNNGKLLTPLTTGCG